MATITYVEHDGTIHTVDVKPGLSVMEGALRHNIPGIDADCGGACACATCHVYVAADWLSKLPEASSMEAAMLEFANEIAENSRLSCQIRVTESLEGLSVSLPESQQ